METYAFVLLVVLLLVNIGLNIALLVKKNDSTQSDNTDMPVPSSTPLPSDMPVPSVTPGMSYIDRERQRIRDLFSTPTPTPTNFMSTYKLRK